MASQYNYNNQINRNDRNFNQKNILNNDIKILSEKLANIILN